MDVLLSTKYLCVWTFAFVPFNVQERTERLLFNNFVDMQVFCVVQFFHYHNLSVFF